MTRIADDFEAISQRLRELQQQLRKDSPAQRRIGVDDLDPSWPDPKPTRPIQCGVCMDVGWLLVSKLPGTPPAKSIYPSLRGPVVVCHACRNPRKMSPSSILLAHKLERAGRSFWQAGKARFPSPEWRAQ